MITFFHISYNLTGKWNFDTDFFQVLTCCNISNFGSNEKCYKNIKYKCYNIKVLSLSKTSIGIFDFFKKFL